jgi:YgiT-type zinc finger domain-containing protein
LRLFPSSTSNISTGGAQGNEYRVLHQIRNGPHAVVIGVVQPFCAEEMNMTTQEGICPICGEGCLEARVDKNPVEYKGQSTVLDAHYSVCDSCGSEQTSAVQSRTNKRAMIAFRKHVDGLLTGAEVRALRERLVKQRIG